MSLTHALLIAKARFPLLARDLNPSTQSPFIMVSLVRMRRINNLTGVRAVAAMWVVLFHLNLSELPVAGTLGRVVEHGSFGVDLFFVLSGFVLSLVYVEQLPPRFEWGWYRRFLGRRLAKVSPLHLIMLLTVIAMFEGAAHVHYRFGFNPSNNARSALYSALMIHSFGLTHGLVWNTPSWSVSAEWFAYSVLFAPMVFALRRVRLAILIMAGVLLLVVMALLSAWIGVPWTSLAASGAVRIVPEFYCGFLLFRILRQRKLAHGDLLTATGAILLTATCYLPHASLWLLLPAIMTLLAGLYTGGTVSDRMFGNRLMVILGDASYSIYLVQALVAIACNQAFKHSGLGDTPLIHAGIIFCVSMVTAVFGLLTFRLVEEPLRQALLRIFQGPRSNPEEVKAPPPPGLAQDTQVSATIG